MKKTMSIILCAALFCGTLGGCTFGRKAAVRKPTADTTAAETTAGAAQPADEGKILNIYCWDDGFKSRFQDYYEKAGKLKNCGLKQVNFRVISGSGTDYEKTLDAALKDQANVSDDQRVDMFLVDGSNIKKYVNSGDALDLVGDVGLSQADLAEQYDYTRALASDEDGVQRASALTASPGVFVYRRSIALDVLGTDEPSAVQAVLTDWNKFSSTAENAAGKGYKMLSGYEDAFRALTAKRTQAWVTKDKLNVDKTAQDWVTQTDTFTQKGYNSKTNMYSEQWVNDQKKDGKVFGFFASPGQVEYLLSQDSLEKSVEEGGKEEKGNGAYGDYGVCQGPESFYTDEGVWLCAAKGTDNPTIVRDIIQTMTCDADTLTSIAKDTGDFVNHKTVVNDLSNGEYTSAFLGGQNPFGIYGRAAQEVTADKATSYDAGLEELFAKSYVDYFTGKTEKDKALLDFYKAAKARYEELDTGTVEGADSTKKDSTDSTKDETKKDSTESTDTTNSSTSSGTSGNETSTYDSNTGTTGNGYSDNVPSDNTGGTGYTQETPDTQTDNTDAGTGGTDTQTGSDTQTDPDTQTNPDDSYTDDGSGNTGTDDSYTEEAPYEDEGSDTTATDDDTYTEDEGGEIEDTYTDEEPAAEEGSEQGNGAAEPTE